MKHTNLILGLLSLLFVPYFFASCLDKDVEIKGESYEDVFESCWRTMDERYCFFEEKKINWETP